jgi:hypothetical protein
VNTQQQALERIAYEQMCSQYGLKPEWLGKTFTDKGKTYTIVGLNIRSKRFPVRTTYESTYEVGNKTRTQTLDCSWNATYIAGHMGGNLNKLLKAEKDAKSKQEREDYKKLAVLFGLEADWLDKEFNFRWQKITIVGLAPNRRKYPVVGRDVSGKTRLYTVDSVVSAMKAKAAA